VANSILNSARPLTGGYYQTLEELLQKNSSIPPGLLLKSPDFYVA
jgi:hypothetical protein